MALQHLGPKASEDMVVGLLQDARAIRNQFQGHLGDVMTDAQRVGAVDVFRRIALLCGAEEDAACIVRGTGLRDMGLADVRWGVCCCSRLLRRCCGGGHAAISIPLSQPILLHRGGLPWGTWVVKKSPQ